MLVGESRLGGWQHPMGSASLVMLGVLLGSSGSRTGVARGLLKSPQHGNKPTPSHPLLSLAKIPCLIPHAPKSSDTASALQEEGIPVAILGRAGKQPKGATAQRRSLPSSPGSRVSSAATGLAAPLGQSRAVASPRTAYLCTPGTGPGARGSPSSSPCVQQHRQPRAGRLLLRWQG